MKKRPLTLEEKKKIPRHLRGAGKRRYYCPWCDTYHGFSPNLCKKNPGYEEMVERRRAAVRSAECRAKISAWSKENFKKNGKKMHEAAWNKLRYDLEYRKVNVERSKKALTGRKRPRGKDSPTYGYRHTLEARLKMSASKTILANVLKERDLEREGLVSPASTSAFSTFDFMRERFPNSPVEVDEFSGGEVVRTWENEESL